MARGSRRCPRPRSAPALRIAVRTVPVMLASCVAFGGAVAGARSPAPQRSRPTRRCVVPGTQRTVDELWRPDMAAAISYANSRTGDIDVLGPMIRGSDNDDAGHLRPAAAWLPDAGGGPAIV